MDRKLIDYLPPVIACNKEYIVILNAQQNEIEKLVLRIDQILNNQFILSSNLEGISRYEQILKIKPKGTDDLSVRQFRVLTKYNEQLPYTYIRLKEMLNNLCGKGNLFIRIKKMTLSIYIKLVIKDKFEEVKELLHRVLPANIALDLSILFNQWGMAKKRKMKWKDARQKSWELMKNEVME